MLKLKTALATQAEAARANERFYRELAEAAERDLAEIEEEYIDLGSLQKEAEKPEVTRKPAAAAARRGAK